VPDDCVGPPIPMVHLHGTADTTWPVEGQSFGALWAQGSMEENLDLWRAHDRCDLAVPVPHETWDCEVQVCAQGSAIRRCLHPQGHTRPDGWNTEAYGWLAGYGR
jgi:polyhydroxybutyrate depolymerase